MSDSLNNEQRKQLLTAYLDNELGPEERAQAESILVDHPVEAENFRQWRENREAIRELPRFRLDDGFSTRVLASIDATDTSARQFNADATNPKTQVNPELNNWRIGLGAIATLAAMLLLTLFVFPAMTNPNVAVNQQPETKLPDEIEGTKGSTENVDPDSVGGLAIRQPIIGTLNSSLPGRTGNGRPVDPIVMAGFTGPSVEQVLWVENLTLANLEIVLANHSIKIVDPDGQTQNQIHLVGQSTDGLEAIYVVATAARMKQAIAEMSHESTCSVKAFPLPGRSSASDRISPENARHAFASAQQIKPFDLSQKGDDATEIASLDKWFGLVDDADESRMIQFLLLVNTLIDIDSDPNGSSD